MNKKYFSLLLILALFMSCKKNPVKPVPAPVSSIEIAGQTYRTFKTGNQEWLISNYQGPGGVQFNTTNSKPEYGKYYSWSEVQAISHPQGWRIPTKDDYIKMAEAEGIVFVQNSASRQEKIKSLTSKNNWRTVPGNNLSGFNAYPAGYIFGNSNPVDGDIAEFWTADGLTFSIQEIANENALRIGFYNNSNSPEYRFNVRFVKDLLLANNNNTNSCKMKTATLQLPTMDNQKRISEVSKLLKKLPISEIHAVNGKVNISYCEPLQKAEIIIAIEEAGYIVIY